MMDRIHLDYPQQVGPQAAFHGLSRAREDWLAGRLRYAGSERIGGHLLHHWELRVGDRWVPAEQAY